MGPVEDGDPDPTPEYRLTDEVTGTTYNLISGFVQLAGYAGQRVTLEGVRVPGIDPYAFNVTAIEPADDTGGTVTATFELTVECQPLAGTEFSGSIGQGPAATGALLDQDGDGVFTTSLPVERGTEQIALIQRLDPISDESQAPLAASTIKDFGLVKFEENQTFSASISFCADGGSATTNGDTAKILPTTGGVGIFALGAATLLVGGFLLVRRIVR